MKRKLLLLTALIAGAITANAQKEWHVQNSGFPAASRGINGFSVVDSNVVWATAYDGSGGNATIRDFSVTRDGGATWLPGIVNVSAQGSYGLANISAIDADTAYASIYPATSNITGQGVYKTTNGGASWTKVSTGTFTAASSFINVVHFFDANDGVALGDPAGGYFEAYTTNNGGATWTRVPQANIPLTPGSGEYGTVGYYGAHDSTIIYPTNLGNILVSMDRGITWTSVASPVTGANTFIPKIEFKNKQVVFGIAGNSTQGINSIIASVDGGLSWSFAGFDTVGDVFDFNDIAFVPGTNDTWFVTSANFQTGGLGSAYTEDGGLTWIPVDKIQHTSVDFADENNGWSGGFNTSAVEGGMFKWGSVRLPASVSSNKVEAFNIYPNPNNGTFYVNAKVNGESKIKVMDIVGKVVFEKTYPTRSLLLTSIDLSNEQAGIYFVEVSENGNRSVQKIVIQ